MAAKTVFELLEAIPDTDVLSVTADALVDAPVVEDSREVQQHGLFVARRGLNVDGHRYIDDAIQRGAAAIIGEDDITGLPVPYVRLSDTQRYLGLLAAAYHDFPARQLVVIGVTGTDGKTTTSTLIHSILQIATGGTAGLISTIAADMGGQAQDTGFHVTTPTAPRVQAYLAEMVARGMTHAVLEATSHGLAEGRLKGVDFDAAVLTNLTHEHLDYHGSFEAYRDAKAQLFHMLSSSVRKEGTRVPATAPDEVEEAAPNTTVPKVSVVNNDDPNAAYFYAIPADVKVRYAIDAFADARADKLRFESDATYFNVGEAAFKSPLFGAFNVHNALAAIALTHTLGVNQATIQAGLAWVTGISGRMERIDQGQDYTAIVDFAHTPNALAQALKAARTLLAEGKRLIAVFGSAGLRDVEKRRLMAETSARLADFTVLTAEDPRTESLDDILAMMAQGCVNAGGVEGETFIRVRDRGKAIYQACQMAQPGDILMVCGKGHEQSMAFGDVEYPWDDRDALRAALNGQVLATLPTAADD